MIMRTTGRWLSIPNLIFAVAYLVWLLLRDPARLSEAEHYRLTFMRQEPTVERAYRLALHFIHMIDDHQANQLYTLISIWTSKGFALVETFAVGLPKGFSALKRSC